MHTNTLTVRLGGVACACLLLAGCANSGAGQHGGSFWSRLNPRSQSVQVARAAPQAPPKPERKAVKDPAALHLAYGRWREQVGDTRDARAAYENVLKKDPKNVDGLIGLSRLDVLAGRTDQAERRLNQAQREAPGSPRVLAAQGQFYAATNRWGEAVARLNEAVLAEPATPEYRYQLAVALARSGDPDAALPHFARTVGAAEAHYNLGYILNEQGRAREAERHLVEALRQRPDLQVAQTMLDEIRGSRSPLTAPPVIVAAGRQPQWTTPGAGVAQAAVAQAGVATARTAPATAPPVISSGPRSSPFGPVDNPFAEPAAPPMTRTAAAPGAGAASWYPTPPPNQHDGWSAAQREQMLNQRIADGMREW